MRSFRLALAQMNPTVGDIDGNTARIIEYVERAREVGADLVAFPELAITGYPPEDLLFKTSFLQGNTAAMQRVVEAARDIAVVVGYVEAGDSHTGTGADIANAAAVGYNGKLIDSYRKMYLPNYGVFDEDRYFRRGTECPVYHINGVGVGVNICEDIWYPVGPIAVQREAGAELIVNINGSPFHAGKAAYREKMIATRAADNGLFVAYLNMVGGQDELVFDGASLVCDMTGEVIARGPAFAEDLLVLDLDIEAVFRSRLRTPLARKENPTILREVGEARTKQVSEYGVSQRTTLESTPMASVMGPAEEVYHALVTGTRDYIRKSGFSRALVGLSGGIDSALTATVAADALGPENVVGVTMPSRYSSEGSVSDSKELADNLGIECWVVSIEPAHLAFTDMLEPFFEGSAANVAEENVQARIRGNVLMTISNKFGWIVLTTGNKSEMAMGYATLYGDMAGGFAVIKDVPKTLVYELCRWRNSKGFGGNGVKSPIPRAIIEKPPSAELRPDQLDVDSLPPYEELDPIVRAYVEEDYSYEEMVAMGHDPAAVRQVITFVDRNEYKRRQAPPGVKITPRAFGKDRRLPIVNRYRPV
ncbi:MAG: NAD+ synthase [Chloroflexota bacterium]|nr:NAD+ synthase [Chloroflexota bacterium]